MNFNQDDGFSKYFSALLKHPIKAMKLKGPNGIGLPKSKLEITLEQPNPKGHGMKTAVEIIERMGSEDPIEGKALLSSGWMTAEYALMFVAHRRDFCE